MLKVAFQLWKYTKYCGTEMLWQGEAPLVSCKYLCHGEDDVTDHGTEFQSLPKQLWSNQMWRFAEEQKSDAGLGCLLSRREVPRRDLPRGWAQGTAGRRASKNAMFTICLDLWSEKCNFPRKNKICLWQNLTNRFLDTFFQLPRIQTRGNIFLTIFYCLINFF